MLDVDVLIVGAGIAGASLAWRLASRCSVLLIEREAQPGMHSTGRSAAMFMESYGPPGVRALTRASRAFYEAPPDGFCETPLMARRGALYVAMRGQEALLTDTTNELTAQGGVVQLLDAAATLACVPCLRAERVHASLYEAAAQDIDVHALHQGFLRGFKAQGGTLRVGTQMLRARRGGDAWHLDLTDGESVRATVVVDAAGAWADEVAAQCAVPRIGLTPRRRSAFTFKAPDAVDVSSWPAVVAVDESWYFKPDAGRLLGSPANADDTVPHDVMPEALDIAIGIDRLQTATTLNIRRPESTWAGLRSFVHDGELVIGFDNHAPGFFWLAAQGGYGIQSAAGASELACALICAASLPASVGAAGVDVAVFSPSRLR
ncbi:MAG: FAD-binding oxidoreductase [Burkholderiales bacterium]|nr:FAD-binding oxidoreductase [Burkholderiales bacterium]